MTPASKEARAERPVAAETAVGGVMSAPPTAMTGRERPTAIVNRVDVSSVRRASVAPADPEQRLFRAYGALQVGQSGMFRLTTAVRHRSELCVCGGELVDDGRAISRIVREHNETAKHAAWRVWREAE